MSYCKFENTEIELEQCVDAMEAAGSIEDLDMNDYEVQAFDRMWHLAKKFLYEHERLSNLD